MIWKIVHQIKSLEIFISFFPQAQNKYGEQNKILHSFHKPFGRVTLLFVLFSGGRD